MKKISSKQRKQFLLFGIIILICLQIFQNWDDFKAGITGKPPITIVK